MPNLHRPLDKTRLSCLCRVKCVLRRSASGGRNGSACAARHSPTLNALVGQSGRLNSHRHTKHDKTVLSMLCLVCRCELALRCFECAVRLELGYFDLSCVAVQQAEQQSTSGRGSGFRCKPPVCCYAPFLVHECNVPAPTAACVAGFARLLLAVITHHERTFHTKHTHTDTERQLATATVTTTYCI